MKKTMLVILDGYGYSENTYFNAVAAANTPNINQLKDQYPNALLLCSGLAVGLPEGQMGNSEVGHLNIGAGRIVYQELTRITKSIDDGDFFRNEVFLHAIDHVKKNNSALHIMGLVSDGGVHSDCKHYKALIKLAKMHNVEQLFIHCFMDGRDTLPTSGLDYITELDGYIKSEGVGVIATVSGRYYAMDRDNRYERIKLAYDAITLGRGEIAADPIKAVKNSYSENKTDEFILPTVIVDEKGPKGRVNDKDSVIFFNFRPDRARQLTRAFMQKDFDGFKREKTVDVEFVSMTLYDTSFSNVHIAYKPQIIHNTLGEYLSGLGKKQLRIAETEKYAHVTYFFNGGIEKPYKNEERILIPSPKVATYDLKPEMSAYEVTDKLIEEMKKTDYDFIAVNYANCDMVGHTGIYDAAIKAVETVDICIGKLYAQAKKRGYSMIITADHGNAEKMKIDGDPFTAHTTNPVMVIVADENVKKIKNGRLCDIAPTILGIMNIVKPIEMDGENLITELKES